MRSIAGQYQNTVTAALSRITEDSDGSRQAAIDAVAKTLAADRVVHVTGSGHSRLLEEEAFYCAAGIAAAQVILDPELMLQ